MKLLVNNISSESIKACIEATHQQFDGEHDRSARLTAASLLRFGAIDEDKPAPSSETQIKAAVVKTGAYYFGPMFVMDKGTSVPSATILGELDRRGFYTKSLKFLNTAQLNLFFITLKSLGLVSDKHLIGYVKYGT